MRLLLPLMYSLAAMQLMGTGKVRAGSIEVSSGASMSLGGITLNVGGTLQLTNTGPLKDLTSSPARPGTPAKTSPLPLQFSGAPVTAFAGLPFAVSTVMLTLAQAGMWMALPAASTTTANLTSNLTRPTSLHTSFTGVVNPVTNATSVTLAKAGTGTLNWTTAANTLPITQGSLTLTGSTGINTSWPVTLNAATDVTLNAPLIATSVTGMAVSASGTITLNSSANAFAGPILLKAGSLVLGVATSLDEADPGTAFSESNPVSLIDSEAGALFPVGTTVRVNGLMSPTAASPTATIENESAGAMIIKRTSSGGLSFRAVPGGTVVPP